MEFHPIADIFPMLEKVELSKLADDIKEHGLLEPIWIYEGKILDGRNRYNACKLASAKIKKKQFEGTSLDAINFVWSLNLQRRHLDASQAAAADTKRQRLYDVYAAIVADAQRRKAHGQTAPGKPKDARGINSTSVKPDENKTRTIRAKTAGTNPKYIDFTDKLYDDDPDAFDQILKGKKKITQVQREKKEQALREKTPDAPKGTYRIIYADPPWKYSDKLNISKNGLSEAYGPADAHYPQMTISELCDLPIKKLRQDNAVLFLWVTSPLLEKAFKVIHAWGFKYKASFVWDKIKHNMGHYNSVRHEFLLICTHGSCTPDERKLYDSVQSIERSSSHSEKPQAFRDIIDHLYPQGARIELFARSIHDGWESWGNES